MSTETDRFDDPILKAAIKGAFGPEKAPDDLRQRILGLIQQEQAVPTPALVFPSHARSFAWRSFVTRMAAALAIGLAGLYAYSHFARSSSTSDPRLALMQAMVATHGSCCAQESHCMPGLPQDDLRLIGQTLGQHLHNTVLAADLSGDGWEFIGASACQVNGEPSAHFVFGRRRARMSVFSLPASVSEAMPENDLYAGMIADHCVAAFKQDGQVYCMVGFCPRKNLKVSEVASLLEKHRANLVSASVAWASPAR